MHKTEGVDLAYGVARPRTGGAPRCVVRVSNHCLDLAAALGDDVFADDSLNRFMARGPQAWTDAHGRLVDILEGEPRLLPLDEVDLLLPWRPPDYVDFYASEAHATNLGRMFRPDSDPLYPNWRHLPVGYHGRTSTIVVSGTPVHRPHGLTLPGPERRPTAMLDVEVEVGTVLGVGNDRGEPVPASDAWERIFGFVLVNDWSARDIQRFEYQPLGPHLGKSFATSVSPWVVPAAAVQPFLVDGPPQDVDDFLRVDGPRVLDLALELELNGTVLSRANARDLYWGPAQLVAHATSNGASTRPGDLYASGTVSGSEPGTYGSLIEQGRPFLEDGDTVTIRGRCGPVDFGSVTGTVLPVDR